MRLVRRLVVCFFFSAFFLAGCSTQSDGDGAGDIVGHQSMTQAEESQTDDQLQDDDAIVSMRGDRNVVRMLVHDAFYLDELLLEEFNKTHDFSLEIIHGSDPGTLLAGLLLRPNQDIDIVYGIDNTLISRLQDQDLFLEYEPQAIKHVDPVYVKFGEPFNMVPIDFGDVCVNYDAAWFKEHDLAAPRSLIDLIKEEYRNLLVVLDPGITSTGMAFLLSTVAKFDDGWPAYWEQLVDNDVTISQSWTQAYLSMFSGSGGDKPLVVSYATSPIAEVLLGSGIKTSEFVNLDCYRQIEYAGILRTTHQTRQSQVVIDWLLSPEVQNVLPQSMFVLPVRQDIPIEGLFAEAIVPQQNVHMIDPAEIATLQNDLLSTWKSITSR